MHSGRMENCRRRAQSVAEAVLPEIAGGSAPKGNFEDVADMLNEVAAVERALRALMDRSCRLGAHLKMSKPEDQGPLPQDTTEAASDRLLQPWLIKVLFFLVVCANCCALVTCPHSILYSSTERLIHSTERLIQSLNNIQIGCRQF